MLPLLLLLTHALSRVGQHRRHLLESSSRICHLAGASRGFLTSAVLPRIERSAAAIAQLNFIETLGTREVLPFIDNGGRREVSGGGDVRVEWRNDLFS